MTNLGPLDALGAIEGGADYDSLLPESLPVVVSGHTVHVLSLAKLVSLKRGSSDPKDKLRRLVLEATLRRKQQERVAASVSEGVSGSDERWAACVGRLA